MTKYNCMNDVPIYKKGICNQIQFNSETLVNVWEIKLLLSNP